MTSLQKLRIPAVVKWVSFFCRENYYKSSKSVLYVDGSCQNLIHLRFCRTGSASKLKNGGNIGDPARSSRVVRKEAQAALLEYLHSTRSLHIMDAENMSKNTPEFLDRLLKRVDVDDADVCRSLARFLRYHPINEFEPFFESIGLRLCEYSSFLPQNMMFLNDDKLLLENYYVLCNYGIARNRIGRIYNEAREVFGYEYGVLQSKLRSFQSLGLKQSFVVKIIASNPSLLIGNIDQDFVEVLGKLKKIGVDYDLLGEHISEGDPYNWKCMLEVICLLSELGLSEEQLGKLFSKHPDILLERFGHVTVCLVGFFLKFGSTPSDIKTMFFQFPQIQVVKFTYNLRKCYNFLVLLNMNVQIIGELMRSYTLLLGSCELKKVRSTLGALGCGKNRLCQIIKDDPNVLKKLVLGAKIDKLPEENRVQNARMTKTKFLLSLGFVENSKEMERALKVFRGKGVELQERFDCLVNNGLSRKEAIAMVKVYPQTLNQSKDVIETKIGFLVEDLGYTIADLLTYPAVVSYTLGRVKLRTLMYRWLKDEKAVRPKLSVSTIVSCSEEIFVRLYVDSHPRGPEFWEGLKKEIML